MIYIVSFSSTAISSKCIHTNSTEIIYQCCCGPWLLGMAAAAKGDVEGLEPLFIWWITCLAWWWRWSGRKGCWLFCAIRDSTPLNERLPPPPPFQQRCAGAGLLSKVSCFLSVHMSCPVVTEFCPCQPCIRLQQALHDTKIYFVVILVPSNSNFLPAESHRPLSLPPVYYSCY